MANQSAGKASSDSPALKPYRGKPAVRNFRGDDGNVGIIRSPVRAIVLPDSRQVFTRRSGCRENVRVHGTRLPSSIVSPLPLRFKCVRIRTGESMVAKLGVGSGKASTMDKADLKQKAIHEFREYLTVLLFLAPLFVAFSTYRMLLQGRFREGSFEYGTALINALILSKIILIGEYLRVGKRQENRPLIYSTVYKSFIFTLLVAAFHVLEDAVRECGTERVWRLPLPPQQTHSRSASRGLGVFLRLAALFRLAGNTPGIGRAQTGRPVLPVQCIRQPRSACTAAVRSVAAGCCSSEAPPRRLAEAPTRREDLCVWKSVSRRQTNEFQTVRS